MAKTISFIVCLGLYLISRFFRGSEAANIIWLLQAPFLIWFLHQILIMGVAKIAFRKRTETITDLILINACATWCVLLIIFALTSLYDASPLYYMIFLFVCCIGDFIIQLIHLRKEAPPKETKLVKNSSQLSMWDEDEGE